MQMRNEMQMDDSDRPLACAVCGPQNIVLSKFYSVSVLRALRIVLQYCVRAVS